MAGRALLGRLAWRIAQVDSLTDETPRAKTLALTVPGWPGHRPGQHVNVRLTAEDGYQTERSYSIASASSGDRVEITIERLEDGEVSPYLTDILQPGDKLELRGPIGGYFVWNVAEGGPLLLIGGGSGVVPLMAMIRQRVLAGDTTPVRLLYSSRSYDEIIYRDELDALAAADPTIEVTHTLTRAQPEGWRGYRRRIDEAMLRDVAWPAAARPLCFVCGPTQLVENAATLLAGLGHDPARIKTERFGPTGS